MDPMGMLIRYVYIWNTYAVVNETLMIDND